METLSSGQGRNEITPKLEIELIKTIITIIPGSEMELLGKIVVVVVVVFPSSLWMKEESSLFLSILSLNK